MAQSQLGLRGSTRCHPTLAASRWLACGPRAPRVYHSSIRSRVLAVDVEDAIIESDYAIVTVHMQMIAPTEIGDDLRIIGSCQALGQWQPGKALKMQQTTSGVWVADIDLPPGTHEFKAVVYNSRLNRTEIEEDTYRLLQVPEEPGWLRVDFRWGDNDLITSFLPEPKESGDFMLESEAAAWDAAAVAVSSAAADSKSVRPSSILSRGRSKTPTAYNLFIGEAIKKLKDEEPQLNNKERMQKALALWRAKKAAEDAIRSAGRKRSPIAMETRAAPMASGAVTSRPAPAGSSPAPRVIPSHSSSEEESNGNGTLPIPNVYTKASLKKMSAGIGDAPPIVGGPEPQPAPAAAAQAPPGPADPTSPAWVAWASGVGVVGAAAAALILNATLNGNGPNVKKMAGSNVTPAKPDSALLVPEEAESDADQPAAAARARNAAADDERPMFMSEREALKEAQEQAQQQQEAAEQESEANTEAAAAAPPNVFEQLQDSVTSFFEQQQQQSGEEQEPGIFSFFEQQQQSGEEEEPGIFSFFEQQQQQSGEEEKPGLFSFFEQQREDAEEPSSSSGEQAPQEEEPTSSFFEQQREELEEPLIDETEPVSAFEEPEPATIPSASEDAEEQAPSMSAFERMFNQEEEKQEQPAVPVQEEEEPVAVAAPVVEQAEEEYANLPASMNDIPDDAEPGSLYEQFFGRQRVADMEEEEEVAAAPQTVAAQPRLGIPQSLDELADMEDASPSDLYNRFFGQGLQQFSDISEEDEQEPTQAYEEPTQLFSSYEEPASTQRFSAFEEPETTQRYSAFEEPEVPQRYSAFEQPEQEQEEMLSAFEQSYQEPEQEQEEVFSAFEQSYQEPEQAAEEESNAPASFFDRLFAIEEQAAVEDVQEPQQVAAPRYEEPKYEEPKYQAPRSAFEMVADEEARLASSSSIAAQEQEEVAVSEPEPEQLSLFERLFAPEEEEEVMPVEDVAAASAQGDAAGWSPIRDAEEKTAQAPAAQEEPEYIAPVSFFDRLFKAEIEAEDAAKAAPAAASPAKVERKAANPLPRMEDTSNLSVFERLRFNALEDEQPQQAAAPSMPQPVPSQPRNTAPLSYFEQMFSSYAEDTNPSSQGWNPILQDFADGSLFDELAGSNLPEEVAAPRGVKSITMDQLEAELGARGLVNSFEVNSQEELNGQSDLKALLEDKRAAASLMKSFNEANVPPEDDDVRRSKDEFSPFGITPKSSNMEVWNDCIRDSC